MKVDNEGFRHRDMERKEFRYRGTTRGSLARGSSREGKYTIKVRIGKGMLREAKYTI